MSSLVAMNQLTMSTREIAQLTGKHHRHVKRDAEKLLDALALDKQGYAQLWVDPQNGQKYTEYSLPKDLTITLVSGYNVQLRHRIVTRWQELEQQQAPTLPNFNSPAEAARAWADEFDQKQQALAKLGEADHEIHRLQGVCHTIAAQFTPGMTPPAFCRQLNGVNVQQVQNALVRRGLLIKDKRGYRAASYYRDKWFAEKTSEPEEGLTVTRVVLTKKGAIALYKLYLNNELPMKATWDGNHTHCLFDDQGGA